MCKFWIVAAVIAACRELPAPEPFRPYDEVSIVWDNHGYIDGDDNAAGIQGRWYSYAGLEASISPTPLTPFTLRDGKACAAGTTPVVEEGDFKSYYGAGIGFHLCYSDDDDTPPEFPYTLSECPLSPLSPNMHTKIAGIAFDLETNLPDHPEIRVIFREWRREESPYVPFVKSGPSRALFHEADFKYPTDADPHSHPAEIHSILFQIASVDTAEQEFDFCISNLRVLINPRDQVDTSPYEDTGGFSTDMGTGCNDTDAPPDAESKD